MEIRKRIVALDCEFVGVGHKGSTSALGRCSIVDYNGKVLCDIYAKPDQPITDYRTKWSGIRPRSLENAVSENKALMEIERILQDKIVVGHALENDFRVLGITMPPDRIRDTQKYRRLRDKAGNQTSLKKLAKLLLNKTIQKGCGHSSLEDARASLSLYKMVDKVWEKEILLQNKQKKILKKNFLRPTPQSRSTSTDS